MVFNVITVKLLFTDVYLQRNVCLHCWNGTKKINHAQVKSNEELRACIHLFLLNSELPTGEDHSPDRSPVHHRANTERQIITHTHAHAHGFEQYIVEEHEKLLKSPLSLDSNLVCSCFEESVNHCTTMCR